MVTRDGDGRSAIRLLKELQLRLAMTALMVMMGVTVLDVFLRYTLNRPIRGAYDIVEVSLAVFVFHGFAAAFLARQNIVIDIIDGFVSARVVRILIRIADALTVVVLLFVFWTMLAPALQAYEYGDRRIELGLRVWVIWVLVLAGLAGTIVCALGPLFGRISARHGGERL